MPAKLLTSGGGGVILQPASSIASDVTVNVPSRDCTLRTTGESVITSGTAVASTSGTSIDFTSIPSWVKRITLMFVGVSTSGGSQIQVQLGAGSIATTGYAHSVSVATAQTNAVVSTNSSAGCILYSGSAGEATVVQMDISFVSGTTWLSTHKGSRSGWGLSGSAYITLSNTLDRIRITTVNGTDTFDAGSINILYE